MFNVKVIKTKEEEEAGDLAEVSSVTSEDGLLEKEKSLLDINEKIRLSLLRVR